MTGEMDFFVFLLEKYAAYRKTSADVELKRWDDLGLTDFIFSMYDRYHSEHVENAFRDIDELVSEREGQTGGSLEMRTSGNAPEELQPPGLRD